MSFIQLASMFTLEKAVAFRPRADVQTIPKGVVFRVYSPGDTAGMYDTLHRFIQVGIEKDLQDHGAQEMFIYGAFVEEDVVGAGRLLIQPDASWYERARLNPDLANGKNLAAISGVYVDPRHTGGSLLHHAENGKTYGIADALGVLRLGYAEGISCDDTTIIARPKSRKLYEDRLESHITVESYDVGGNQKYTMVQKNGVYQQMNELQEPLISEGTVVLV